MKDERRKRAHEIMDRLCKGGKCELCSRPAPVFEGRTHRYMEVAIGRCWWCERETPVFAATMEKLELSL